MKGVSDVTEEKHGGRFRPDRDGTHRRQFDINKKRIYATQDICGICGKPVDKTLPWPNPLSKSVDHIVPVSLGGHPSDIDNMQLAHLACNRAKSNKLMEQKVEAETIVSNRLLPQTKDWTKYHG